MLTDYRTDKWYGVFTQVLLKTLQAARLSASVADFLTCSLEAMSPRIAIERSQRLAIIDNFWRVLQNAAPVADASDAKLAVVPVQPSTVWPVSLQKLQHVQPGQPVVTVDLDKLTELFESTLTFRQPQVRHDEQLHVDLYIRTRSEISFKLSTVRVVLADSTLQFTLTAKRWSAIPAGRRLDSDVVTENDAASAHDAALVWQELRSNSGAAGAMPAADENILLQPNVCYKFAFVEADYKFPENEELRIVRLELTVTMGTHSVLLTQSDTLNAVAPFRRLDAAGQSMDMLPVHRCCYVVPTFHVSTQTLHGASGDETVKSVMNTTHQHPMLTNEYFRIEQVLGNTSASVTVQAVGFSVTVPPALKASVFLCTAAAGEQQQLSGGGGGGKATQRLQSALHFELGDLRPHARTTIAYYVVALCEANIDLRQRVWYQLPERGRTQTQAGVGSGAGGIIVESPVHKAAHAAANAAITSTIVDSSSPIASTQTTSTGATATSAAGVTRSQAHNMNIERLPDGTGIRKCREDVIIVPCVEELSLRARFYTLNKQPLRRAYCDEDVLLRVDVEARAPGAIDVLEMFLISVSV